MYTTFLTSNYIKAIDFKLGNFSFGFTHDNLFYTFFNKSQFKKTNKNNQNYFIGFTKTHNTAI